MVVSSAILNSIKVSKTCGWPLWNEILEAPTPRWFCLKMGGYEKMYAVPKLQNDMKDHR
jgi:hypothetical protein